MSAAEMLSGLCLFLTALFTLLWYITPRDSTYETVELEVVHTKKVWLVLALCSLGAWAAIRHYLL